MAKTNSDDISNVEKLKDIENFPIWKFQLSILFRASDLFDIVNKNIPEDKRTQQWIKSDAHAQKIIITTLERNALLHIMNCLTANEMWTKICTIYERDNEQQRCGLLQKFYSLSYEKGSDMATYISKLKNLATRLTALKTNIDDDMIISKILSSLPEEQRYFASAWESTEKNGKTLENLTARLIAEEMRTIQKKPEEKAVAFKVTGKKCYKCNKLKCNIS